MHPGDLELYTTQELVDELMRRKTFLGVVVHSEAELREQTWSGDRVFKVHYNSNLDHDQTCRLLHVISAHMDRTSY